MLKQDNKKIFVNKESNFVQIRNKNDSTQHNAKKHNNLYLQRYCLYYCRSFREKKMTTCFLINLSVIKAKLAIKSTFQRIFCQGTKCRVIQTAFEMFSLFFFRVIFFFIKECNLSYKKCLTF